MVMSLGSGVGLGISGGTGCEENLVCINNGMGSRSFVFEEIMSLIVPFVSDDAA